MLSRRLIRIKVFHALFSFLYQDENRLKIRSSLQQSLDQFSHNFIAFIALPQALWQFVETNHNPNENKLISEPRKQIFKTLEKIANSTVWPSYEEFQNRLNNNRFQWTQNKEHLQILYNNLLKDDKLIEQINQEQLPEKQSVILFNFIKKDENISQALEEFSYQWADDQKLIFKIVNTMLEEGELNIPPLFKDEEDDLHFAFTLYDQTTKNKEKYTALIESKLSSWDLSRIARIDYVLMLMAISEFINLESVPTKVTMNEYLELAKTYSTPDSSKFINGILDNCLKSLKSENKIKKIGRGLVE